ncbi:MAG TPA: hypothetical protein VEB65_02770 [Solirubrobacterales bacterium]|nr:hypothetical protein [Solirubrobacterales bacterium]
MKRFLHHLSYANVVATLALFLAIGGATSYAATEPAGGGDGHAELKALAHRVAALEETLKGVSREGSTLLFDGMNLQLQSGLGKNGPVNGLGNLIVGYNEHPRAQTGSGNLVMGTLAQGFSSSGAIVAGERNEAKGANSVVFGQFGTAKGEMSTVLGGQGNIAGGDLSVVGGGYENTTGARFATAMSGAENKANGIASFIGGGRKNETWRMFETLP